MTYFFGRHLCKGDYDYAFNLARDFALGDGFDESPTEIARRYEVKPESLCQSVRRAKLRQRGPDGLFRRHGGSNKMLNDAQEEAIRQFCYEQWELGLGATHKIVYTAICYLKKVSLWA